jgi:hypothetical protein
LEVPLHVPIGLLITNWGATDAESWVSRIGLIDFPNYTQILNVLDSSNNSLNKTQPFVLFNAMIARLLNFSITRVILYRGESNKIDKLNIKHNLRF